MKIGFVLYSTSRIMTGGLKVIFTYANALFKLGHQVIIYVMSDHIRERYRIIPDFFRRIMISYAVWLYPRWIHLEKGIKKVPVYEVEDVGDNDVVIATAIQTSFFARDLPERCGRKYYFIQDFENWQYTDEQVVSTYTFGMKNIVVSNWLKGIVDEHAKEPSVIVENAIDTKVFCPVVPYGERYRHSIAFHYRSPEHKGCRYALEALSILAEKYADLQVMVVSTEIPDFSLPDYCKFIHSATPKQVAEVNNNSRFFLCSSIHEGFGLPGLEAMACGCVLVSTNYEGVLEYAVDGENALLSPVKDAKAMAKNVERLFNDYELCERLSQSGIKTARLRSEDSSVKKLESVLMRDM